MRVDLKTLRSHLPQWEWRAARSGSGFGWDYVGTLAFAQVVVRRFAVLCGPSEDDFRSEWRVTEGQHSEPLALFMLRWSESDDASRGLAHGSEITTNLPRK